MISRGLIIKTGEIQRENKASFFGVNTQNLYVLFLIKPCPIRY